MKNNIILYTIVFFMLFGNLAFAHKLKVFAYAGKTSIKGYCYYPGGARARGINIMLVNNSNEELAKTVSNESGEFIFSGVKQGSYSVTAKTPDGHGASFKVKVGNSADIVEAEESAKINKSGDNKNSCKEHPELSVINNRLRAIEERIMRQEDKLAMRDILGGIGYIFGFFGIAAYLLAKKKLRKSGKGEN